MSNLSPSTLALLRAAKTDAPSKESRAAIWGGVTSGLVTHTPLHITPQAGSGAAPGATSIAPAAGAAATAKGGLLASASFTGMKGAFIGALFGSAISIGVATFMMRAKSTEIPHAQSAAQATTQVGARGSDTAKTDVASANTNPKAAISDPNASSPSSNNSGSNASNAPAIEVGALRTTGSANKSGSAANSAGSNVSSSNAKSSNASSRVAEKSMTDEAQSLHSKKSATPVALDDDSLDHEGSLVREASRDLQTGDPTAALKVVMKARALEARQMEPEEMDVQAKALRALGRDSEALKVESQLRTMYPGQTLGR